LTLACVLLAGQAEGRRITTVESLAAGQDVHPIQQAFIDSGAIQCGYCTPAMLLAAYALIRRQPRPSEADVREALSGVLCRCTGYTQMYEAVKAAIEAAKPAVPGAKPWVGKPPLTMAQLPKECGTVLTAGGFTPESPAAIAALATKDAGPPIPRLTAAQLQALIAADPNAMPLPDRNPMR